MSNLSCGIPGAEPTATKDCRKLLNQYCRFLPKLKLPISADAKLPLTRVLQTAGNHGSMLENTRNSRMKLEERSPALLKKFINRSNNSYPNTTR